MLQRLPKLLTRELVERAERLVEQQQRRIMNECTAQRCALLHAARELPRKTVLESGETDFRKKMVCPVAKLRLLLVTPLRPTRRNDLQRQHYVLTNSQPRQQRRILKRHADANILRADLASRDEDVAARGIEQVH